MNNEIAAALFTVKQHGRLNDLEDRIAAEWSDARERKNTRTIGGSAALACGLHRFLKLTREQADEAAERFFNPSYTDVATDVLLALAKEISAPRAPARPSRCPPTEELLKPWNPHDGGLSPEELTLSARPEGDPEKIPPAIRRATQHAIQHRVKARRTGR
ncbi:MAG TPA: hypothetical protein VHX65_10460 [Pirellulales bacterium]|nr:hypothetical protein [Pirellulales bacterium]